MLAQSHRSFRFHGRSFLAFVLTPAAPLQDWLLELETWVAKTPDFFSKKPLILDLSRISLTRAEFIGFLARLRTRQLRLISVEGVDPDWLEPGLEPLPGGTQSQEVEVARRGPASEAPDAAPVKPEVNSLLLHTPVRSGQSVYFPLGDVTVAGSVSSGAEIISGGSIHVYGALRGRAFAGAAGNPQARIFCQRFEAELIAIGGYYKSPENIDPDLIGRPVQAWLEGNLIMLKVME
ncbi:Septum site-determining protein MinC [hydrothermal vent metagenome]|uniref:Septum site-determining protein MinC n=1 Tax=hydrothermal vent metagenome TaxID=652676 RepID=A0A3B0SZF9_9ZZZZ